MIDILIVIILSELIVLLAILVVYWADYTDQLHMELAKTEQENIRLAARLTELNHENEKLKQQLEQD